ncbi:N-acetyltransferase family protein [Pluralibacter gergoviae]|nr:GNAT family N-acetyltransferase [Pluralibacter gergoviae]
MLQIRLATEEDAPRLSAMGKISYPHHFAHLWHSPQELAAFVEQEYAPESIAITMTRDASRWLIATRDGADAGFAKFSFQRSAEPGGVTGTLLHKLYLMPGATGAGCGEAMMNEVIRQAKAHGERYLWLEVLAENPRARRFYERLGMTHLRDTTFASATQVSLLHVLGMRI